MLQLLPAWRLQNIRVGADLCVRPRVSIRFCLLLMSIMRWPGGCIACVPISPDVTKIPFPNLLSRTIGQILRVGADRRVRPYVSKIDCLRSALFDSRLRGGCIACVPRSPDVTRNPVDLSVRLGLAVTSGGQVGRPSPMVGVIISDCGGGYCHRGWCPPCQPPNGCWLAVSDS